MNDPMGALVEETKTLLEPGDIDLVGVIVTTEFGPDEELEMIDETIEIGDTIGTILVDEPTYIYSGNDDPNFSSNQHQLLTIDGDEFVWECQQLLIEGVFRLVFYFEDPGDLDAVLDALDAAGHDGIGVRP